MATVHILLLSALFLHAERARHTVTDAAPLLIDIVEPAPPRVIEHPRHPARPATAAGAPGKRAEPSRIESPEPVIASANPAPAAPDTGVGAATAGEGVGAGGVGAGTGGGRGGSGRVAQWISGALRDGDYPRAALQSGASGTVSVRFTVLTSGRIANCRIAHSSGYSLLDETTCRLLTERLRFLPASDDHGRAVTSEMGSDFTWGIRRRN
nr:energy transducer TonB [uncultured Sphingomonas sp.]